MTDRTGMSVEETGQVFERYAASQHSDVSMMSPDVVFRVMATGQEFRTPEGVLGMLNWFYHGAFEARADERTRIVGEGIVAIEADFVGRHTGEFAGIAGTGKDVNVPLAVVYELRDGRIAEGRIYFETPAFMAQVGALG
jgi:predicted ester cyclase